MRDRQCIDKDWMFLLGDAPESSARGFDDDAWRRLDLPHDFSIEGTPHPDNPSGAGGGFFPGGIGWYRKRLRIPEDLGGRRLRVEFDGIYMNSEVWCNGHSLGVRPYGYSSFAYDLTPYVTPGEMAVLAVRADNARQKNCRWYSGSGIYRHVWLTRTESIRVGHWGAMVTTPVAEAKHASILCNVEVASDRATAESCRVRGEVIGPDGHLVDQVEATLTVGPCEKVQMALPVADCANPLLWSPEHPDLYIYRVVIEHDGTALDTYDTTFGIRSFRFDADEGFILNGTPMKLKGVNEHHDAGCVGAAVPDDMIRRRFRILKEMGCNAIRVAHNPASPVFLDLCDEMGFLVVEDAFDEWKDGKTPFGYGLYWDDWWEKDLVDMIRRDRNHASVIMWSVGNEIKEVREGRPEGLPMMKALQEVCHREDPTRPMTCGCCNSRETLKAGYAEVMDVFGVNGGGGGCFDYVVDHQQYPEMVMFASEVPHSLQTRGVYRTRTWYRDLDRMGEFHWYPPRCYGRQVVGGTESRPVIEPAPELRDAIEVPHYTDEEVFTGIDEHYQSSYDNALVRISSIDSWRSTRDLPYLCGEFRWTGFDYLGECYGWPCKSWNFGVIDLCGFPKDTFFFYQSEWTHTPMVHALPHWTWPGLEGKCIPVMVYTNCPRAELFLNDASLGVKERDEHVMVLRWDATYAPGTLKVLGYDTSRADVLATCEHQTSGEPTALKLDSEDTAMRANGTGVVHIRVLVVDDAGRMVPHANPEVEVKVSGAARLIGLENGDPLDTTNYKLTRRRAFHGMMLAVLQSNGQPGRVMVEVSANGLAGDSCSVVAE